MMARFDPIRGQRRFIPSNVQRSIIQTVYSSFYPSFRLFILQTLYFELYFLNETLNLGIIACVVKTMVPLYKYLPLYKYHPEQA